ncbi:hypothetical protein BGZ68_000753 [Mortierella alpina]|nr:hypothetical protein BGZ68_000753 [Mortierella alpina]
MSDYEVTLVNDNMQEFYVRFHGPTDTPFAGGVYRVHVELPDNYPYKSPSIGFMNKIFHPNIDELSGSVCLDVINQTWSPMFDMINIFEVFLPQLLRYPNPTDPLNGEAAALLMRDSSQYEQKVKEQEQGHSSVKAWEDDGGDIWDDDDSLSYDRAIAEKEWSRLHETFGNTGYREGIEEGKEGTLQQGFNQGWSEGVNYGHELGRLRGLISPLLEYVRSSTKTETTPSTSSHPLSKLNPQERDAWMERASELIKELTEIDIAKVFDKAYFDDGRGPSHKAKAAAAGAAAEGSTKSGCCGGASSSSSSNGDACCKKSDSTAVDGEASACQSETQPSQSCCSSKGNGTCASKESEIDHTKDGSSATKDEEWSSRPEQVISEYQNRVRELLKEAGLESLMDTM